MPCYTREVLYKELAQLLVTSKAPYGLLLPWHHLPPLLPCLQVPYIAFLSPSHLWHFLPMYWMSMGRCLSLTETDFSTENVKCICL